MPRLSVDETPNEWRVAVRGKPRGKVDEWATLTLGQGVALIRYRKGPDRTENWHTQSITFDKDAWTKKGALAWAKDYVAEGKADNPELCKNPKQETIVYEKYGPGKFDDSIDEWVYEASPDDELGSVQDFGWYGLLLFDEPVLVIDEEATYGNWTFAGAIITEDSQGFVYVDYYDTKKEAKEKWSDIEDAYTEFVEEAEEEEEEV